MDPVIRYRATVHWTGHSLFASLESIARSLLHYVDQTSRINLFERETIKGRCNNLL